MPRVSCMHSLCWRLFGWSYIHFAIRVNILCERRRGGDGHALRRVHGPFFLCSVHRWVTLRLQEAAQVLGHLSGHPGSLFRVEGKEEGEADSGMFFYAFNSSFGDVDWRR